MENKKEYLTGIPYHMRVSILYKRYAHQYESLQGRKLKALKTPLKGSEHERLAQHGQD